MPAALTEHTGHACANAACAACDDGFFHVILPGCARALLRFWHMRTLRRAGPSRNGCAGVTNLTCTPVRTCYNAASFDRRGRLCGPNAMDKDDMQVTETLNEGLKRGYSITVSADELDAKVNEKLKEAQPEIEMKGFRKGKVPMPLLKKQFGQRLLGEAMQETIDGAMSKHFEDSGDRPALQPEVKMTNEDWKEGDDVHVDMSYEKLPEMPEVDLSSLSLEKLVVKAGEADVDEALGNLDTILPGFHY